MLIKWHGKATDSDKKKITYDLFFSTLYTTNISVRSQCMEVSWSKPKVYLLYCTFQQLVHPYYSAVFFTDFLHKARMCATVITYKTLNIINKFMELFFNRHVAMTPTAIPSQTEMACTDLLCFWQNADIRHAEGAANKLHVRSFSRRLCPGKYRPASMHRVRTMKGRMILKNQDQKGKQESESWGCWEKVRVDKIWLRYPINQRFSNGSDSVQTSKDTR